MSAVGDSVVVPRTGVEPVWDCSQRILSPQRLPVPPPGQAENKDWAGLSMPSPPGLRPGLCPTVRALGDAASLRPAARNQCVATSTRDSRPCIPDLARLAFPPGTPVRIEILLFIRPLQYLSRNHITM